MKTFDVYTTVRVRVKARDMNAAENKALDIFDKWMPSGALEIGVALNPFSEECKRYQDLEAVEP